MDCQVKAGGERRSLRHSIKHFTQKKTALGT